MRVKLEVPTPFGDHQIGVPTRTAMRGAGSGDHTSGLAGLVWCLRYVDHDLTVTAIDRRALGRPILAVDSDALRQLAQRRGPSPLRSEQILDHCAGQGLVTDPVRRQAFSGQQQREGLLLLA